MDTCLIPVPKVMTIAEQIEPKTFRRVDGLELYRQADGTWLLRKVTGLAWYYNIHTNKWDMGLTTKKDALAKLGLPFQTAWALFCEMPMS